MNKICLGFMTLILFLTGCGTGDEKTLTNADSEQNERGDEIVAGEIVSSLIETSPSVFQFVVKNQAEKEVTLEFTSSQRFDYSVNTLENEDIFLYSSVTSFLQVLGKETLKQGDDWTYDINLKDLDLKPGKYRVTAWMTPKDSPAYEVTKEFIVK